MQSVIILQTNSDLGTAENFMHLRVNINILRTLSKVWRGNNSSIQLIDKNDYYSKIKRKFNDKRCSSTHIMTEYTNYIKFSKYFSYELSGNKKLKLMKSNIYSGI